MQFKSFESLSSGWRLFLRKTWVESFNFPKRISRSAELNEFPLGDAFRQPVNVYDYHQADESKIFPQNVFCWMNETRANIR